MLKQFKTAMLGVSRPCYSAIFALLVIASGTRAAEPTVGGERSTSYYRVIKGKVDKSTETGWQVFHYACYGCHGVGAVGTAIAPDLTQRIKRLSPAEFAMTVLSRYRVIVPLREGLPSDNAALRKEVEAHQRGPRGRILMPAWEADSQVKPHILDLYGYLRARADGAVGPDRLQSFETAKH